MLHLRKLHHQEAFEAAALSATPRVKAECARLCGRSCMIDSVTVGKLEFPERNGATHVQAAYGVLCSDAKNCIFVESPEPAHEVIEETVSMILEIHARFDTQPKVG